MQIFDLLKWGKNSFQSMFINYFLVNGSAGQFAPPKQGKHQFWVDY